MMSFDIFVGRLVIAPSYSSIIFFFSLFVCLIQLYVSFFFLIFWALTFICHIIGKYFLPFSRLSFCLFSLRGFPGGSVVKNPPASGGDGRRHGFDSWVRKIPWRMKGQPTPVFLPGKFHGQRSLWAIVHEVTKNQTQQSN